MPLLLRIVFILFLALFLILFAFSNGESVSIGFVPHEIANMLGIEGRIAMPMFVGMFGAMIVGVLVGFILEWFREMRFRRKMKTSTRRVDRLERELAVLKDAHNVPPKDEVLAILDAGDKR